ncbi:MAG: HAD family hydrolase [Gammaproteobacteria bacterium]|nr:HAD family hydrolase [Gammaproteobacteria bacterium]
MSRSYDLIIFDCDGVIVDSEVIGNRVFRQFLAELGLSLSEQEVYARFLGRALADSLVIIEGLLGRPVPPATLERYKRTRDETLRNEVRAVEGVEDIIGMLDVPFCVASSGDHSKMQATLGATGLLPLFDGRIFSAVDVARAKPAPDIFLHAVEQMRADPGRTTVIEDTVNGVRAARAAEMTVYGYAGLTPAAKLTEAGAHKTFAHMRELEDLLGLP